MGRRPSSPRWLPALLLVAVLTPAGALVGAEMRVLDDDSAAKATSLGNEALVEGRLETAIGHYRRALERDPRYFQALFNLALAQQQLAQLGDARKSYEQALALEPDSAPTLCNLGWLDWREGALEDAARRFGDAARVAAARPAEAAEYWFALGSVRERQDRVTDARRAYEQALACDGRHYGARYNLGTLLLGRLDAGPATLAQAREHLEQATAIAPKQAESWLNLAICRERQGDAGAEAAYDRAVAVARPDQAALARWRRALWYDRLVPPRKIAMRDDLIAVLAADAAFPEANGRLGAYYHAIGEYDKAILHLEREVAEGADQRTPVDIESHFLLAEIYADRRPDARKALYHATACQQATDRAARLHDLQRRIERGTDRDAEGTPASGARPTTGAMPAQEAGAAHAKPADAGHDAQPAPGAHH